MLTQESKKELERQKYKIVGSHSAVKICGWTKKAIRNEGFCYKQKFYGIMSHQCLQMSTSLSCANRCIFCWRGYKAPVAKEWCWYTDDPQKIFDESIKAQYLLLTGMKGYSNVNKKLYEESKNVKHVALSLTGEPIIYPRINELLQIFNKNGISTFIVTNAQYPEAIRNLAPVTQLYLSLDAAEKDDLKKIDRPLFSDYWKRLNKSLELCKEKRQRTCIRLTMVKHLNMEKEEKYAELIKKAEPDFIELKGYMLVGASREKLTMKNMPLHEEVVEFAKKLIVHLPDYEICSEHIPSRAVLIAHKKFKRNGKWHCWIDFKKWNELINSGKYFSAEDYSTLSLETGLSGKGTLDTMPEKKRKEVLEKRNSDFYDGLFEEE